MHKHFIYSIIYALSISLLSCTHENNSGDTDQMLVSVKFKTDETVFPNPERGLYTHRGYESGSRPITTSELKKIRQDNITLIFTSYFLKDFINRPISDAMLQLIQDNFDVLRTNGMKAVLRFAYSKSSDAATYDADQEIILTHIAQLKPLFQKNKDVIAVMEAGFIGAWGEWWYSTHYGNGSKPDYDKRRIILNALLDAMPKERMISLRTPLFKTKMLNISFNEPLTETEAYNQTHKARLSHHNDCFLADAGDMGTYKVEGDRTYAAADSRYTCVGGETCTQPTTYSECAAAIEAMSAHHWSYINIDYHKGILNDWHQKGCFDEIQKRLGYRFVLTQVRHSKDAIAGSHYELILAIDNKGFAAPYNPRQAEIRFRSVATGTITHIHKMDADPRFWFSGNHEITEKIKLPQKMETGEYEVLLFLPDPAQSLYEHPEYSIRMANKDTWEEKTGYNKLYIQEVQQKK